MGKANYLVPDFTIESRINGQVAGVDEAGRGPLAGPVLAAAVVLTVELATTLAQKGLNDGKKLTPKQRRVLCSMIREQAIVGIGAASVTEIDQCNILKASLRAMTRAVQALPVIPEQALVDGPYIPQDLPCRGQAVIKGDRRCLSIAAASVVAKVMRDHLMDKMAVRYPRYGWQTNRGYPTLQHRLSLMKLGPTEHHRRSCAPVKQMIPLMAKRQASLNDEATGLQLVRLRKQVYAIVNPDGHQLGTFTQDRQGTWSLSVLQYNQESRLPDRWHNLLIPLDGRSVDGSLSAEDALLELTGGSQRKRGATPSRKSR